MAKRRFILPFRQKRSGKKRTDWKDRGESRRFASKVSMGIVIVGGIIALVAVANKWMQRESLESIKVIGTVVLDTAEVLKQAAIPDTVTIQKLDLKQIEERVAEHPFIASAAAYYGGEGELVIEINERSPVAVTVLGETPVYLDANGVVLPFRFGVAAPDVPVLSGLAADGKLDSSKVVEAIAVAQQLHDYGDLLYRRVSEIQRSVAGEYTLVLADDGVPVVAGKPEEIIPRLPKLEAFMNRVLSVQGAENALSIDLRWDGQVVVRWKQDAHNA